MKLYFARRNRKSEKLKSSENPANIAGNYYIY